MANNNPIGFFDSGVGGLTIWNEVVRRLPNESTVYLADSKHAPYGPKGKEKILDLCVKNVEFLIKERAKIVVVACNTATTNAISELRNRYSVPFVGIEPAVKPASLQTRTKRIGVLATKGTLTSALFEKTSSDLYDDIEVIVQQGKGLVECIEKGKQNSKECLQLLKKCILPMLDKQVDVIVLGCSHYPLLIPAIRRIIPCHVQILDSGIPVARQVQRRLNESMLNSNYSLPTHKVYSNLNQSVCKAILSSLSSVKTSIKKMED